MSKVTFCCKDDLKTKVPLVCRQTNYTEEEALIKLQQHDNDEIKVIKEYMGITTKKEAPIKSLNQEMYKQIRHTLDEGIKDWNEKQEIKVKEEIQKIKEENSKKI